MYLRLLQIRDIADVGRYLTLVARVERDRGRFEAAGIAGQNMAPDFVARATASALRTSGTEVTAGEVEVLLQATDENDRSAAARGYADLLRLIMDHAGEIPFAESQIKYFHSLLLRYDPAAAGHRRQYRGPGVAPEGEGAWVVGEAPPAEAAAAEMPRLVGWTREMLEAGEFHPLLAIGTFLARFLWLRPFAAGNRRLGFALAVYLLDSYGYTHVRQASLEEVLDERREAGAEALREASGEREDATAWVHFLLDAVSESQRRALERLAGGTTPRLTPRLSRLLDAMRERRAAKIGDLLPVLQTPRATLKKDLRALVDAGYLVSEGVRKGTVYHVR